jgi:hypothetical protein
MRVIVAVVSIVVFTMNAPVNAQQKDAVYTFDQSGTPTVK